MAAVSTWWLVALLPWSYLLGLALAALFETRAVQAIVLPIWRVIHALFRRIAIRPHR